MSAEKMLPLGAYVSYCPPTIGTEMTFYNISNATQLTSALTKAVSGDKLLLHGGNYGSYSISGKQFSGQVTIYSTEHAHFDSLSITKSANLAISGVDVGRGLRGGEGAWTPMVTVNNSSAVKLSGLSVHGSVDGNLGNDGRGISVNGSADIQILGTDLRELSVGIVQQSSSNTIIMHNKFHQLRSDGIDSSAIHGTFISGNTFTDFRPGRGDHPDAIQFFNTHKPTGSSDITIQDNQIMQGDGVGTQGIFISDAGPHGYSNVNILNNLVYSNDQYNGIAVAGAHGLQIANNSVVSRSGDNKFQRIYVVDSSAVQIHGNVAEHVLVAKSGSVTQNQNIDLSQHPSMRSLFGNLEHPSSPRDLIVSGHGYQLPDGIAGLRVVSMPHTETSKTAVQIFPSTTGATPEHASAAKVGIAGPDVAIHSAAAAMAHPAAVSSHSLGYVHPIPFHSLHPWLDHFALA